MPLCLPPRRGMVGQKTPLMAPDLLEPCTKIHQNEHQISGSEPSAPSPGFLLYNDEEQSDAVFFVGPESDAWRLPVHSWILSTASPVFQAMLSSATINCSDWPVSDAEAKDPEKGLCRPVETVYIPDIDPIIFQNLLRFVYTKEVRVGSVKDAINILLAANKYMIFDLVHICLDYINGNLNPSNVLCIYQNLCPLIRRGGLQESCDNENLQNELLVRCTHMIDMHAEQILRQDDFSNLQIDTVHELLNRDTLQVRSEMSVHEAIITWACQECKRQKKELVSTNKCEVLGKSVYCVRYLLMTADEFVSGPGASGILSDEKDFFLKRIREGVQGNKEPLPEHLSDKKLDVNRTSLPKLQSPARLCAAQRSSLTNQQSQNIRKNPKLSKRVLQGLGDFVICVIQILD